MNLETKWQKLKPKKELKIEKKLKRLYFFDISYFCNKINCI